jgi:putative endonuclease
MKFNGFKKNVGRLGEDLARQFLIKKGYKFIESNYEVEDGEIDLIMKQKNTVVFIEVKTRITSDLSIPEDAIDFYKIRTLEEVAEYYIYENKIYSTCRIDAVCILLDEGCKVVSIKHYEDVSSGY